MSGNEIWFGVRRQNKRSVDELFQKLSRAGARYLLVGGQAMRLTGMPRFSMDWDLFIPPRDTENFAKINEALRDELDLPVEPLGERGAGFIQTYQTRFGIVQFHLLLPGVPDFFAADRRGIERKAEAGAVMRCLCGADLLAAKEAANRPVDQLDIEFLRELRRVGKL